MGVAGGADRRGVRNRILLLLLALVLACLYPAAAGARASYRVEPRLEGPASRIAGRPVEVRCYEHGEPDDPFDAGAWGYVYLWDPVEYQAKEVCDGALGIADNSAPLWEQALGALALTHESYHLALRYRDRGNEAQTECRAIRHFGPMVGFLGGDQAKIEQLRPYALSIHYRIAAQFPEYNLKSCNVPFWWH